jgi:hypothetical protein
MMAPRQATVRHAAPPSSVGVVALIHRTATITPTKQELLAIWLPGRPWLAGVDVGVPERVAAYRFDDPENVVGIETLLMRTADGRLLQLPLTYRGAPLDGAEAALVGTTEHSVLGPRWVYDGCADPVSVHALATAILTGGHEAGLEVDTGAGVHPEQPGMRVLGSGTPPAAVPRPAAVTGADGPAGALVDAGGVQLTIRRLLDGPEPPTDGVETLTGTWPGVDRPVLLATARPS